MRRSTSPRCTVVIPRITPPPTAGVGAHAEQMADRDDQVGAVQGVEMEFVHSLGVEPAALLGGDRGGDEAAGVGIVVEPGEMTLHPGRDRGAADWR